LTNNQHNQLSPVAGNAGRKIADARRSLSGYSIVETVIVVALICVLSAIALPQIVAERRLTRSVGVTREILSQMRYARQLAMSQRQAFTFQYNNTTKQISIIDHNSNPGAALFLDPTYPNNLGSVVISTTSLANSGLFQTEIAYGIPPGLPNGPLADGISMTPLTNNQLNVTFQPDGSVIDLTGNPVGRALYIYNNQASQGTASAISVMGASGRVKIWRYDRSVNLFVE
jgi:type II secretory pathway pseudopilin PulG